MNYPRCFQSMAWVVLYLSLASPLVHGDPDLDAANRAYTYGNYEEASGLFQKIIDRRGYSASLCFDLANAEARAGHFGPAMLNYERARYLDPADKAIDHNLQLERKKAGLRPNSYRWWEVMLRGIDWSVWMGCIAAGLVLIFLSIVGLSYWPAPGAGGKNRARALRNIFRAILFAGVPLCLLLGYIELMTVGFAHRIDGVIVAPKAATLWVSPIDSSDSRGTIPEGELVTVENRHNDYVWIEARDNQFGWVRLKDIEPVIAGSFDEKGGE